MWPWKRVAESGAQAQKAKAEAEVARREYEKTVQTGSKVSEALAALFYHAEQNRIVENIQKVARGQ